MNEPKRRKPTLQRHYPESFRREVVRLLREGSTTLEEIGRSLNVTVRTLRGWMNAERHLAPDDRRWREFLMGSGASANAGVTTRGARARAGVKDDEE